MGRLSRHRKVKSCDPFFKGQKHVDIRYDIKRLEVCSVTTVCISVEISVKMPWPMGAMKFTAGYSL